MFHLLAYTFATGGAVTDSDSTAATDTEISQRNSHYIFTEDYNILAASGHGATMTRANIQTSTLNAVTRHNIFAINRAVTIATPGQIDQWTYAPIPIPKNEEFQIKVTDTASEQATNFVWIGTTDWNRNIPAGMPPVPIFEARVTATPTSVANTWTAPVAITFEQNLRGGIYAVVGAEGFRANGMAFRLVFPRNKMYHGRRLRPGTLFNQAVGDFRIPQTQFGPLFWGEWGRFSTFEPPTLEVFCNDAAATSCDMRLFLVRLSNDMYVPLG
jgi:hypothetical protein